MTCSTMYLAPNNENQEKRENQEAAEPFEHCLYLLFLYM